MADSDLKKMNRERLAELLLAEKRKTAELEDEIQSLRKKLEEREIKIENSGSIAEASLSLNGVFEAAESACRQYVENVERICADRERSSEMREEYSKRAAEEIIAEAKRSSETILAEAIRLGEKILKEAKKRPYD
ncbi:MAG: hypothetical protein IJK58_08135 [Clostridia bacterium]|nr:hypothetical protein [Clostridia bacterium]